MIPNEPLIYQGVVTESERLELKEKALTMLSGGLLRANKTTQGDYRNFRSFHSLDEMFPLQRQIYHRIVGLLGLENPVMDPMLGSIISIVSPGGFIQRHTDKYGQRFPQFADKRNVRFNLIVERGEDPSYDPIVAGIPYRVNRCDAWCFAASELRHGMKRLAGKESRIVYQFGFMMDALPKDDRCLGTDITAGATQLC